jgi:hypothetical protein
MIIILIIIKGKKLDTALASASKPLIYAAYARVDKGERWEYL